MSYIPAASISGIDHARIRLQFPEMADEIARLGDLLDHGKETTEEFLVLARLLNDVGEHTKAEELLRHNVVNDGDSCHRAYLEMFGHRAEEKFKADITHFADQWGVSLSPVREPRFLKAIYVSRPQSQPKIADPQLAPILGGPCEVAFRYDTLGTTADISSELPALSGHYVILRCTTRGWQVERASEE